MKKHGNEGFSLVELMIVIGIMVVLISLIVGVGPIIWAMVDEMGCKKNLGEIYNAMQIYKTKFGRYPDRGGDLFLAKLYHTKCLTEYSAFICPSDRKEDSADFTDKTAEKCCAYEVGKTYETADGKKIVYDWEREEEWMGSWESKRTFKPTEISYAARWNLAEWEKEDPPAGWEDRFELTSGPSDPTIVVCDDIEDNDENNDPKMIHGDHLNALFSNGAKKSIIGKEMGAKGTILEAMKN